MAVKEYKIIIQQVLENGDTHLVYPATTAENVINLLETINRQIAASKVPVDTALSTSSTNLVQNKAVATGINDATTRRKTLTIYTSNWVQNSSTKEYEYTVTDSKVTANHLVEGRMDLANQKKMVDGCISSYNGGFKIKTSEKPTSTITMYVTITKTIA